MTSERNPEETIRDALDYAEGCVGVGLRDETMENVALAAIDRAYTALAVLGRQLAEKDEALRRAGQLIDYVRGLLREGLISLEPPYIRPSLSFTEEIRREALRKNHTDA